MSRHSIEYLVSSSRDLRGVVRIRMDKEGEDTNVMGSIKEAQVSLTPEDRFWEKEPQEFFVVEGGIQPVHFHKGWKIKGVLDNWVICEQKHEAGIWIFHTCTQKNHDAVYGTPREATRLDSCSMCGKRIPKTVIDTTHLLAMGGE